MEDRPEIFFSIIIPSYNRAHLVSQAIKSILDQKNVALEVIVVDDGGTDETEKVVRNFSDDRLKYISTANRERGAARNSGLKVARGLYVNFFDSDDIFNPCLPEVAEFIKDKSSPPVLYGSIENVSEGGNVRKSAERPYNNFKEDLLYNNFLACGSVFIKRDVAVHFLFSEDRRLSGTEDWELWLRLYSAYDFTEYPGVIFKQRHHVQRSLNDWNPDKIEDREKSFFALIKGNYQQMRSRFSSHQINLLLADRMTFVGLILVVGGYKKEAWNYMLKAMNASMSVFTRKRFWAIAKKIVNF